MLACVGTAQAGAAAAGRNAGFGVSMSPAWIPGDGSGVAAFMLALKAARVKPASAIRAPAATTAVTSCADDNGSGTLRNVVAAASEGDTIDLGALTCSVITLAQGAIPVMADTLTISGPGQNALAIDGAGADRVFVHYGYYELRLNALTVRNGVNVRSGYKVAAGGCIASNGYITLDHSTVSGCVANGEGAYGGGIIARGVTLYTSTLSGNVARGTNLNTLTASYGGGAFAYHGTAALYDSSVSGNGATLDAANPFGSYDTGGGIFADNGGYALRSTIDGNYSSGTGGGIASHAGFFVTNSTISGNIAKNKSGGGIFVRMSDAMSVSNSTIAHNSAFKGGGIYVAGTPQSFELQSTIVADNAAGSGAADIAVQMTQTISGANNLVVTAAAAAALPGDTLHAEPNLLPLAHNGGPTRTHALAQGSPAINMGNDVANLATDQRGAGFPRVVGAGPDIGAYESAVVSPPPVPVPALPGWLPGLLVGALAWPGLRILRRISPS